MSDEKKAEAPKAPPPLPNAPPPPKNPGFVTLTIDGKEVVAKPGTNMIEAAKTVGSEIAYYCYHPRLSIAANCRMCMVESSAAPPGKLVPACQTAITEGAVIKTATEKVLHANPDVDSFRLETQQQAYERIQHLNVPASSFKGPDPAIKVSDMPESYWITMKDPHKAASIKESVQGLDGVANVQDLHNIMGSILGTIDKLRNGTLIAAFVLLVAALLLVANTIRLAAFARRREIGIMRLVGASTLYIALPFLLEALVTAAAGIALAGGALAAVMKLGVMNSLSKLRWDAWVGWHEYWIAVGIISVLGVVMTVAPTLLLTRKYIKV